MYLFTIQDGAIVLPGELRADQIKNYRRDSKHSLASYNSRRRFARISALIHDLQANWLPYTLSVVAVLAVLAAVVFYQDAYAQTTTCGAWHLVKGVAYCLN